MKLDNWGSRQIGKGLVGHYEVCGFYCAGEETPAGDSVFITNKFESVMTTKAYTIKCAKIILFWTLAA